MNGDASICALNLFDIADRDEYLAYSRRSSAAVETHGGRVIALGNFSEAVPWARKNGGASGRMFPRGEDSAPIP